MLQKISQHPNLVGHSQSRLRTEGWFTNVSGKPQGMACNAYYPEVTHRRSGLFVLTA